MAVKCLDCGSQHLKVSEQGACLACDSFNVQQVNQSEQKQAKSKEPKTLIEIFIMALVWALLVYGIWDRYVR